MKKLFFLLVFILSTITLIVGCTKPNTAEEAHKKVNLEADEIYSNDKNTTVEDNTKESYSNTDIDKI